jgi:hypothetical protein
MQYAALLPDEVVKLKMKRHWGILVVPAVSFVALVALNGVLGRLLVVLGSLVGLEAKDIPLHGIKICLVLPALVYLVFVAISYLRSEITVTNRRIMAETWFIGPQLNEIFLSQVESVSTILPRMGEYLGYGSVVVTATGGASLALSCLAEPHGVHAFIRKLVADMQSDQQMAA